MIRAMLEAYRRTLEKTMAQARSMGQVVAESAIPLIEVARRRRRVGRRARPPDEVERVLERTAEDVKAGRAPSAYVPAWYGQQARRLLVRRRQRRRRLGARAR